MKFEVERTSYHGQPCKEAVVVDSEATFKIYTIEINSLEELMKFINKYGKIVIIPCEERPYIIEIYDGWRE